MTAAMVRAKWIVTGVHDRHTPEVLSDAGLVHENGKVLAVGAFETMRERYPDAPVTQPSRFADLDNVLLAPHCIAWTHELFRDIGRTACQGMVDLTLGQKPRGLESTRRPIFFRKRSFSRSPDPLRTARPIGA